MFNDNYYNQIQLLQWLHYNDLINFSLELESHFRYFPEINKEYAENLLTTISIDGAFIVRHSRCDDFNVFYIYIVYCFGCCITSDVSAY